MSRPSAALLAAALTFAPLTLAPLAAQARSGAENGALNVEIDRSARIQLRGAAASVMPVELRPHPVNRLKLTSSLKLGHDAQRSSVNCGPLVAAQPDAGASWPGLSSRSGCVALAAAAAAVLLL